MQPHTEIRHVKHNRAQVMRDRVRIRLATNEAGAEIEKLFAANDIDLPACDFSVIFPHWLIATIEDEVIGCIMILPAKPFGLVEFLLVKPTTSFKYRAIAVKKLAEQAAATLMIYGSSYLFCTVNADNRRFADILLRHGMVPVTDGQLMAKRLKQ